MKIQSKRYRKTHCISWIIVSIHLQCTWIKNIIFGVFGIFATVWAQLWAMCVLDAFTNEIASKDESKLSQSNIFFLQQMQLSGTNAVWNEVYCFILPSEYWESWPKFQRCPFEVTLRCCFCLVMLLMLVIQKSLVTMSRATESLDSLSSMSATNWCLCKKSLLLDESRFFRRQSS